MATPLRWDLIPAILEYLPLAEAEVIGLMDPTDYLTHVEAYSAIRRHDAQVDELVLHDFLVGVLTYLEKPQSVAG